MSGLNSGGDLTRRPFVGLTVKTWPEALRYCRVERGFSFADVFDRVKVPANVAKGWEYGVGEPDRGKLRLLYQALPKLRNYAHLLPESLKHEPHEEPTGEPTPPAVAAEVVKAKEIEMERPSKIADYASHRTFGDALAAALKVEGMNQREFSDVALLAQSRVSAYIRGQSMIQQTYDKLCSLLPGLERAPKPQISERTWNVTPGRKAVWTQPIAPAAEKPRSDYKHSPKTETLAKARAAKAALRRVRMAQPTPLPAPAPKKNGVHVPAATESKLYVGDIVNHESVPADVVTDPGKVQELTEEMNKYGAAYGLACATVVRLRHSMQIAEAQVREYHEKIQATVRRLGTLTE